MTISIIIAVKAWQKNLEECVSKCLELDFRDFEIIILPDEASEECPPAVSSGKLSVFPTGPVCPSDKRDLALKYAKGEIFAFLDDDAYPDKGWLRNAAELFRDDSVAAVGGPAVTPASDSLMQRASGAVYSSPLVSGNYGYRYLPRKKREVDDLPSCNFLVRRSVMRELGGFNTAFWPGEDTKFCLDITRALKKKIIYDPKVLVYHHRRRLFLPHLRQIANYALHRGFFVKKYPETSLRLPYFLPSLFTVGLLLGGVFSVYSAFFRQLYLSAVSAYLSLAFIFSISKELPLIPPVFSGIILSHITYGIFFLKGLFSTRLKEGL